MQKLGKTAWLFDFYGELLTGKQQQIFKLYYYHDFSLAEIAEEYGISRQAVYDIIKRSEQLLIDYEKKLNLYGKFLYQKKQLEILRNLLIKAKKDRDMLDKALQCVDNLIKLTTTD